MANNHPQYYFAYASNMRHAQMRKRCPHAEFIGAGYVKGLQLSFGGLSHRWGGGAAVVLPRSDAKLWGAIYKLDADCIANLDDKELFYHHTRIACYMEDNSLLSAYTYIRNKEKMAPRAPSHAYLEQIITGAKESGLPAAYIDQLAQTPLYKE